MTPDLVIFTSLNVKKLHPISTLPEPPGSVVAFSTDGRLLATGSWTDIEVVSVRVYEVASGHELYILRGNSKKSLIIYLTYSPDGHSLAFGSAIMGPAEEEGEFILWDFESGQRIYRFEGDPGAISPDWQILAIADPYYRE